MEREIFRILLKHVSDHLLFISAFSICMTVVLKYTLLDVPQRKQNISTLTIPPINFLYSETAFGHDIDCTQPSLYFTLYVSAIPPSDHNVIFGDKKVKSSSLLALIFGCILRHTLKTWTRTFRKSGHYVKIHRFR